MGSFSLIKSSTDTLCKKPHRMEGIIPQRCLSVIPQLPAGPSEPTGTAGMALGWLWGGFGTAASHPGPRCCVCGIAAALSALNEGGLACPSATPPGCPPAREGPRSPAAGWQPVSAIQVAG